MTEKVQFDRLDTASGHQVGVITLNAERSLNSLNKAMLDSLYEQFSEWQEDSKIVCIFLQGAGEKAFCAGGDVRSLRQSVLDGDTSAPGQFFEKEYRLDYLIHTYPKPVICWGNGVIMGGGFGLMAGADFRVVTDTSVMAMPEITIGLYPDVGGSWILNRLPAKIGLFMALTGCRLNPADAMYLGLANRFIDHAFRKNVLESLQEADWSGDHYQVTSDVVQYYADNSAGWLPYSKIREHRDLIARMMDKSNFSAIIADLKALETEDSWLEQARNIALTGSALSAVVAYEQFKKSRYVSLKEVFQSELVLSINCVLKGDFQEGVRALLVDKDNQPQWAYPLIEEVPREKVVEMFTPPWGESANPLSNL
ncbi:enoyl-CoA hydratase/isomerase family protein [Endozoicomonas sp. 8E]|uniref:enoyl-CoA hydratase/isomerase family protein n=1 Tax=Endozoicomonas sp. 8E TaxID=3035692 RepID=UPI002938F6E1|nr:enoyl-CoA hydratase/isomerase family protein [Endozoicomonas sp. 8E]WOG30015.1 enoyl-CoA hydratase/isomerase family protein [Endozoicomonas sp. 8E]